MEWVLLEPIRCQRVREKGSGQSVRARRGPYDGPCRWSIDMVPDGFDCSRTISSRGSCSWQLSLSSGRCWSSADAWHTPGPRDATHARQEHQPRSRSRPLQQVDQAAPRWHARQWNHQLGQRTVLQLGVGQRAAACRLQRDDRAMQYRLAAARPVTSRVVEGTVHMVCEGHA